MRRVVVTGLGMPTSASVRGDYVSVPDLHGRLVILDKNNTIVAVLGIINTMSSIAEGPEVVGEKVAAALTGTMLGIFCAYGFVNPLAGRIRELLGAHKGVEEKRMFGGLAFLTTTLVAMLVRKFDSLGLGIKNHDAVMVARSRPRACTFASGGSDLQYWLIGAVSQNP